ncbi:similar to An01g14440 [Aspergillus luchuensis]|uniref:Similar to An01g14440 n=1 Tax=Aspergillus kawachii TaxID=1069201 RepID=A0A146EZP5_ASPKA|nr:similar to An01g14440 [Aspergillus luchuensis]
MAVGLKRALLLALWASGVIADSGSVDQDGSALGASVPTITSVTSAVENIPAIYVAEPPAVAIDNGDGNSKEDEDDGETSTAVDVNQLHLRSHKGSSSHGKGGHNHHSKKTKTKTKTKKKTTKTTKTTTKETTSTTTMTKAHKTTTTTTTKQKPTTSTNAKETSTSEQPATPKPANSSSKTSSNEEDHRTSTRTSTKGNSAGVTSTHTTKSHGHSDSASTNKATKNTATPTTKQSSHSQTSTSSSASASTTEVLFVVSKYAVYQAHLWQKPGFVVVKEGRAVLDEETFKTKILDYLASDTNLKDERLTGSSKYPSPDTKVYIGTPLARTGKQAPRYPEQVKRIAAQVNSVLGLSAEPTEYDYETIKSKDDSDEAMSSDITYGEGKFLFQYRGSCASPTWQVWYGGKASGPLWEASQSSAQKRSDSCSLLSSATPATVTTKI